MQKLQFIFVFFLFLSNCLLAQPLELPVDETLKAGQEIEVSLSSETGRVSVLLQNVTDGESIVYRTMFVGDQEKPEDEIGPKAYRTVKLAPKIDDENEPVRRDKKELVLNTGDADKIILKVKKGEVNIQVVP